MQKYPDVNKLIFFTDADEEEDTSEDLAEESSTDDEFEMPNVQRKSISSAFKEEGVLIEDLTLAKRMLTWSVKNRIDTQTVNYFFFYKWNKRLCR